VISKKLFLGVILLTVFFVCLGCTSTANFAMVDSSPVQVSMFVFDDTNKLMFSEVNDFNAGSSAFDVVKELLGGNLEYQEYSFGVMITSIYGVDASSEDYWALYVDGNYASKGISDYVVNNPTLIEWRLEKISAFSS